MIAYSSPTASASATATTPNCAQTLAQGARVVVHEAMRQKMLGQFLEVMPHLEHLMAYHSDIHELGAMAKRIDVPTLVLTHLIPAPEQTEAAEQEWIDEIREGGFTGEVIVARDLTNVTF
jgi:ribonuclease Z